VRRRRFRFSALLLVGAVVAIVLIAVGIFVPQQAELAFGPPSPSLRSWQRFEIGLNLLVGSGDLITARDPSAGVRPFNIDPGDTASMVAAQLEQSGLIRGAQTFRSYLIWTGLDTTLPAGSYSFSPAMTPLEIAQQLQAAAGEVKFEVLAGWRMEEIAASLPTSGLAASPDDFLAAASRPVDPPDFLVQGVTSEGFLLPGEYILPRSTGSSQLVAILLRRFDQTLTPNLRRGWSVHGLTVYQAVTLASIIQREAVVESEMPLIASVFYNRLAAGMKLESDPTVQYALGFNAAQSTWWTNPLSLDEFQVNSAYNTYLYPGLPRGPICNPGLAALQAVANPAVSDYLYFRARCDGSGLHVFAKTFEQHLQNACP
jgi:UPF0755 protein